MEVGSSPNALDFLAGGGETGALIRAKDWSKTPLGPPATWPRSLKTCVRIVLTSRQPMFVWWGDELLNLYNDAYRSIVGGKHPQALGQPASVVWREIWDQVGPRAETAIRRNEGTYDEALLLIMERNGYPEETYYTFSYSPVPGDDGRPCGIICANTDDTQRILGERQLKTLRDLGKNATASQTLDEVYEKTVRTLAENGRDFPFLALFQLEKDAPPRLVGQAPAGASAFDAFLAHAEATIAQKSGAEWTEIEVLGGLTERFGPLPTGDWAQPSGKALLVPIAQSGQRTPFAVLAVGTNPYRLLDETYLGFFRLVSDQVATSIANVRAYAEERRRAEALREIDRAKTLFFSNVSHEFRTPLTLMLGPLEEALSLGGELPAPVHENLETAHRNALRLQKLVNSLLDFSRIEAGRMRATFAPTDLAALTTDLASNFRSVVERAGMALVVACPPLPQPAYVDREMWEKIVLNLLSNAFKYTLDGQIAVRLAAEGTHAVLRVADTGVGIPAAELPRLFERFHRVAGTRGRSFEGTGIGLSLIKELVGLHGGTIGVESAPGLGSTFTIRLPLGKEHLPAEAVAERPADTGGAAADPFLTEARQLLTKTTVGNGDFSDKTAHVLVVDDNADMRAYIQRLLEPHYRITTAPDGQAALWLVAEHHPDLVLSDVMMPVMDGFELLKTLKADPQTARIPVVLLSARAGEEATIEGYEAGADDYLVKPFSANELLARVRAQLKIARLRQLAEKRLQTLFEQAPVGIAILRGPMHTFEMANDFYVRFVGRHQADEIVGKPLLEALPEIDGQGFFDLLTRVVQTGEAIVFTDQPVQLVRNGGLETGYFNFTYQPLPAPDAGVFVIAVEVTESVLARRKIEENEERLRLALEGTQLGTWEYDPQADVIHCSERTVELFGFAPGASVTLELALGAIIEADRPRVAEAVAYALQPESGGTYDVQYSLVNYTDGQRRTIQARGKAFFDENGFATRFIGTALDVTEQKRAEMALRESDRWFRQLADSMPQIVWTARPDGYLDYFNQRWYEFLGEDRGHGNEGWLFALHPDDRQPCLGHWRHCLQTGEPYRFEFRLTSPRHPDEYCWYLAVAEPLRDEAGGVLKWFGSCTNIHDQKTEAERLERLVRDRTEALQQANAELQRSNLNLTQFAYVASHDLQEPLRKIQAFGDMLLRRNGPQLDAAGRDRVRRMQDAAERMSGLIQDLLNYSRVSTRRETFQPVDLDSLLAHVRSDLEMAIREKAARLHADPLPTVAGDPTQLRQVLQNLLSNALKFSKPDVPPRLEIRHRIVAEGEVRLPGAVLAPRARYHEISVSDNGIGFDEQFADRIFEAFQRLHGRAEYSGTGIGLAIVKKVLENHHGGVSVSSRVDEGSTFRVYLPVE